MDAEPRRARNRKRQMAGVLLFAVISYPLTMCPFGYANGRGWLPDPAISANSAFVAPAHFVLTFIPGGSGLTLADRWRGWHKNNFDHRGVCVSIAAIPAAGEA